jgi:DNA-binding CsgD family transcriptional regulator
VYVEEAELLAKVTGGTSMQAFAHAMRAIVSAHTGQVDRALTECDEASALAARTNYGVASRWVVIARCFAGLSASDPQRVWDAARPMCEYAESHRIGEPMGYAFLPDAVEALISLGHLSRAAALLDRFEECARLLDRAWALGAAARCRGLLCAAHGDIPRAVESFERALELHRRIAMPMERARTLLYLGAAQRRRRLWTAARATLQEALDICERIGAAAWASRAAAELARTHIKQAPADLSPTELRVAQCAATGLTNRQIAEQLFVSAKTVEANLSRVYTKLNIRSRAELGARMAEPPFRAQAPSA